MQRAETAGTSTPPAQPCAEGVSGPVRAHAIGFVLGSGPPLLLLPHTFAESRRGFCYLFLLFTPITITSRLLLDLPQLKLVSACGQNPSTNTKANASDLALGTPARTARSAVLQREVRPRSEAARSRKAAPTHVQHVKHYISIDLCKCIAKDGHDNVESTAASAAATSGAKHEDTRAEDA